MYCGVMLNSDNHLRIPGAASKNTNLHLVINYVLLIDKLWYDRSFATS